MHCIPDIASPSPGSDWKDLTVAGRAEKELVESEVTKGGGGGDWGGGGGGGLCSQASILQLFCSHLSISVSGALCFMKDFYRCNSFQWHVLAI